MFHFGAHPANPGHISTLPSSDTIAGALLSAAALLGDDLRPVINDALNGVPSFLVSSALPDVEGMGPFIPRPQRLRPAAGVSQSDTSATVRAKQLKRAAYVELSLLDWYKGSEVTFSAWGPLLVSQEVPPPGSPWATATVPGVTIDRSSGASSLYHQAMVTYNPGKVLAAVKPRQRHSPKVPSVGWAIHLLARDEGVLTQLQRWFELLALTGIGGRRSRGAGTFEFEFVRPAILPVAAEPRGLSLSWVAPTPNQISLGPFHDDETLGYRVVQRPAWVSSPWRASQRTKLPLMVAEGSYFNPRLPRPVGSLVEVSPFGDRNPHPVYRWGFGLFLDESGGAGET